MNVPPPQGSGQPMPPPYPMGYGMMMGMENALSKRMIWSLNAVGLGLIYLGFLIGLSGTADPNVLATARFFAFSGGLLGALVSTAGALGSRRTTDMQNLGLFLWAGFLLVFTSFVVALF